MTYHDKHDPELHPDYQPSTFAQAAIGGAIMLTIALAFYGAVEILHSIAVQVGMP